MKLDVNWPFAMVASCVMIVLGVLLYTHVITANQLVVLAPLLLAAPSPIVARTEPKTVSVVAAGASVIASPPPFPQPAAEDSSVKP